VLRESPVRVSTCLRRRNAGSRWILCAMFVTSRLVVEDGNILPRHAAFVGPNRSLDEATKTLDGRNDYAPESGTPATISTARFPVIHGPMRAAPHWHARIGRWVTRAVRGKLTSAAILPVA